MENLETMVVTPPQSQTESIIKLVGEIAGMKAQIQGEKEKAQKASLKSSTATMKEKLNAVCDKDGKFNLSMFVEKFAGETTVGSDISSTISKESFCTNLTAKVPCKVKFVSFATIQNGEMKGQTRYSFTNIDSFGESVFAIGQNSGNIRLIGIMM